MATDSEVNLTGCAVDLGWVPHKPETWAYRFADLKSPIIMRHFTGKWSGSDPVMDEVYLKAGHRVKIVMVSRMGDIGITEKLDAENGYGARLSLDDLCNFGDQP